jgi:hypothetical protein
MIYKIRCFQLAKIKEQDKLYDLIDTLEKLLFAAKTIEECLELEIRQIEHKLRYYSRIHELSSDIYNNKMGLLLEKKIMNHSK